MVSRKHALEIRRLSMVLSASEPDKKLKRQYFKTLHSLQRCRPVTVNILRVAKLLGISIQKLHPKFQLWDVIASPKHYDGKRSIGIIEELKLTEAWRESCEILAKEKEHRNAEAWNYRGRLTKPNSILAALDRKTSNRILFWHHHDSLGIVPNTWLDSLKSLKSCNWTIIASSSYLNENARKRLLQAGITISIRENFGLCLGAHHDFIRLASEDERINEWDELLLLNDSTLPIGKPDRLANWIENMSSEGRIDIPQLMGFTDSVERGAYHLQSYGLLANKALLRHPAWKMFWKRFKPVSTKDEIIETGEIELSQTLMKANVKIKACCSIANLLVNDQSVVHELQKIENIRLIDINLSLLAWESLLQEGFPFIKKQILFNPPDFYPNQITLAKLKRHVDEPSDKLLEDIQSLMRSRHLKP
ncbi:rhamnan synthesis F family protein [Synechococcus sp. GEYO]|uniref:rhamnan synthesis F family protein n=1 Tax=Synechococcus sp. GEYO TaxID=2575511 RepID=UPI000E0F8E2E|nr:rhamnan synthesis F family protein [Synechococcus sp. GEYO]